MTTRRRLAGVLAGVALLASAVTGCGDTPDVCEDVDALQESADNLRNVEVGAGALDTITTELATIQSTLRELGTDASEQYAPEVDAVRSEVSDLRASVVAATADPSSTSLAAVRDDVRALGTAVGNLGDAIAETC